MNENDPQNPVPEPVPAANPALVEAAKEAIELQKPIEVTTKAPDQLEATAALTEEEDEENIFVAARTVQEMAVAQTKLVGWADKKMSKMKAEIQAAEANLEIAKKRKWATEPFKKVVAVATRKYEFYEKAKAALEAGYTIIPDMPFDVFAVRTSKKNPKRNDSGATSIQYGGQAWVKDQETNNPALGEGKFVRPKAIEGSHEWEGKNKDGSAVRMQKRWATEFMDDIDFPFKFAKPVVLNAAAQALSEKIFDQIGVAPSTNGGSTTRHRRARGDPMVIGRIFYRKGYQEKGISFLVTWFIDSKDL